MSLVINTNLNALAAQNSAGMASKAQSKAIQRLSTGLSINSAADDAAGLAISNRMTSNINGLGKAIKNANDGINMAQTADSALSNTTSILQRMRELAVQASNGSNSDANRQSIQAEVSQLKTQIDQIATSTNFNDINLLDGSAGKIQLQVGINQGQTMSMNFDSTLTKDIGIGSRASLTSIGKSIAGMSYGDLTINGVQVGPSLATSDTVSSIDNQASAIAKAAAINAVTAQTGVVATVSGTSVNGASMTAASSSGSITINGVTTSPINTTTDSSISRQTVVNAINNISAQTGVTAVDTGDAVHGVQLFAADGRNINVGLNQATGSANTFGSATTGLQVNNNTISVSGVTNSDVATWSVSSAFNVGGSALSVTNLTVTPASATLSGLASALQTALRSADSTKNGVAYANDIIVSASSSAGTSGSLTITSASGRALTGLALTANTTGTAGTATNSSVYVGDYQLSSPSNSPITLGTSVGGNISNADLSTGTYAANTAQVVSASRAVVGLPSKTVGVLDASALTFASGATGTAAGSGAFNFSVNGNTLAVTLTQVDKTLTAFASDLQSALRTASTSTTNGLGAATVTVSGNNLVINSGSTATIDTASTFFTPAVNSAGTIAGTPALHAGGTTAVSTTAGQLDGSSLKLNGVVVGAAVSTDDTSSDTTAVSSIKSESAIAIAAAINRSTNLTGVTAVAQPNVIVGSTFSNATSPGTIYLNGVTIQNSLGSSATRSDVANLLNSYTGQTGVVATDNGKGLTLTAADGRNISIGLSNAGVANAANSIGLNSSAVSQWAVDSQSATTTYAQVALQSNKQFTVQSGTTGDANLNALGFSTGTFGGASNGLKIAAIDVSTQTGAQNAITAIDAALVTVSANQSRAGAFINRLNDVVENQTSMQTNMTASRSAIQDTDYSAETTNLAKSQIISQAATAMLAQANQSSQNVLALLK